MPAPEPWLRQHFKLGAVTGEEAAVFCPFHDDKRRPALYVNMRTGKWKCHAGCGGGSLATLIKRAKVPPPPSGASAPSFASSKATRYVPADEVSEAERRLRAKTGADALAYLKRRGITPETVKRFRLGLGEDGRIWIPVFDAAGDCVNVRRYDWTKLSDAKFLNYSEGYGDQQLWPADVIAKHDEVILFEGEPDVLLAHSMGVANAACSTGGADGWEDAFTRALAGKEVLVCYDIDDSGRRGAALVARKLLLAAKRLSVVSLPISQPANGDFTDYCMAVGFDRGTILALFEGHRSKVSGSQRTSFNRLAQSHPDETAVLHLRAVVSGKDLTPFNVPAAARITCVPDEKSRACQLCPLKGFGGSAEIEVPPSSKPVLRSVLAGDFAVESAVREYCEVPRACPGSRVSVTKTAPLWDLRLSPDVDSGEEEGGEGSRRAFSLENMATNQPYDLEVVHVSDPKTQYSLLQILRAKASQTSLDAWTKDGKEHLLKIWEV